MNAFVLITYLTLGISHIKNYTTHKIHITVFKAKNCEASVDCKAPSCIACLAYAQIRHYSVIFSTTTKGHGIGVDLNFNGSM